MNGTYKCFRGSLNLPELYSLSKKYNLNKVQRIRNRQKNTFGNCPSNFLKCILQNEKKIERCLRSKSNLDSLFELCPLSPWRATTQIWEKPEDEKILIYLDFKNFYPSILCSTKFPNPNKLEIIKCTDIPNQPGILRAILHPKNNLRIKQLYREIHPFQLQVDQKSCPFYIDGPIETLFHTNESLIWQEFFNIEPLEAIVSETSIDHPLKNKVITSIETLNAIQHNSIKALNDKSSDDENQLQELKLIINAAATTPKIAQNKSQPSPYGVHCLSSQIISNGRALLFEAIHKILSIENTKILQINTDGFLLSLKTTQSLEKIKNHPLVGDKPGQLRIKAQGNQALLLGPNTWWLVDNNKITNEAGTGRKLEQINKVPKPPIPTTTTYLDKQGKMRQIDLLHLSDFRHSLNHNTGCRSKFCIHPNSKQNPLTPFTLTEQEKTRSWKETEKTFKNFRETIKYLT